MTVFNSFISLNSQDKRLVLKSLITNWYVRIITWIFPFNKVYQIAKKKGKNKSEKQIELSKLIWSVNVTSNYVIRSTCLTKALSAQIILEQHDYHPNICIGVMKDEEFEAHAWVKINGKVVLGQSEKNFISIIDL